jgi:hypothetical protein
MEQEGSGGLRCVRECSVDRPAKRTLARRPDSGASSPNRSDAVRTYVASEMPKQRQEFTDVSWFERVETQQIREGEFVPLESRELRFAQFGDSGRVDDEVRRGLALVTSSPTGRQLSGRPSEAAPALGPRSVQRPARDGERVRHDTP